MMTTTAHNIMAPVMRPLQESSVSRPRAVYSIDQILGTQTKRSGNCEQAILPCVKLACSELRITLFA
uniref:Uncharacterized protein n=1 Tax=Glossina palpalis gambiensis TaxID=67801 RepID=A0A1B0B229_9MUSC